MTPLLEATGLTRSFPSRLGNTGQSTLALAGVDLVLERGETLAVVGESGCGKTTLGRCLLRLLEPDAGSVRFDGVDILSLGDRELRRLRRRMQMVFQDPMGSLDPRMRIGEVLAEPMAAHRLAGPEERRLAVARLVERVGLSADTVRRLPHEFSGGQRQRIAIARALATDPDLLVADEPVSSLDVSVRAQIVNLLAGIQGERGLAMLFIAHDLALVEHLADRVAVMYRGRIVETASTSRLFAAPRHPYTVELLSASTATAAALAESRQLPPEPAESVGAGQRDAGCPFRLRCLGAGERCAAERPELVTADSGHRVACHFPGSIPFEPESAAPQRNFSPPGA
ncbi:MAG: ABC transporter ATP-binding protein [Holophagales bacterium]|nr:MAG: ABC transporter ATP-binding protein [Holophagales bacterium]